MEQPSGGNKSSLWPLALLGILVSWLAYKTKTPHPNDSTNDASSNRKPTLTPVTNAVPSQPENTKTKTTCRPDHTPWWKTLGEGIALLGGIGLLIVNIYQMRATQDAVTNGKETNQITRDSLLYVQRAFVFITNFDATRLTDSANKPDGRMRVAFMWENGGNTPTKNMITHTSIKWFRDPLPNDFTFPDYPEDTQPFRMFVGPKGTSRTNPIVISAKDMLAIKNHHGHLYFWGWTRYHDTFPKTAEHITRFCSELTDVIGDLLQPGNVNIQTANCERGNCYDDECKSN